MRKMSPIPNLRDRNGLQVHSGERVTVTSTNEVGKYEIEIIPQIHNKKWIYGNDIYISKDLLAWLKTNKTSLTQINEDEDWLFFNLTQLHRELLSASSHFNYEYCHFPPEKHEAFAKELNSLLERMIDLNIDLILIDLEKER